MPDEEHTLEQVTAPEHRCICMPWVVPLWSWPVMV